MRIIAKSTIIEFYKDRPEYSDAQGQLEAWYAEVRAAHWKKPSDVKALYRSASILKSNRVVFNICGNKYRLVVKVNYPAQIVFIRFIGTHRQYDSINAEEI
ncbi:MAG: type II toxin-antitoxin system HigB family toxin [Spirochaetes bacterium]|nr:type II toxin-antitoxin system HigB family toxin [Spirochaetota bacterium]